MTSLFWDTQAIIFIIDYLKKVQIINSNCSLFLFARLRAKLVFTICRPSTVVRWREIPTGKVVIAETKASFEATEKQYHVNSIKQMHDRYSGICFMTIMLTIIYYNLPQKCVLIC